MATKPLSTIREEEYILAEKAYEEYELNGITDKKCPRCGGSLIFENDGSAYRIKCESGDFQMTSRGL